MRMTVAKAGVAIFSEGFVQAFAVQPGVLCNFAHAAGTGDDAERVTHKISVPRFQRRRDVGNLAFFAVEIIGGVKSRALPHPKFVACRLQ